MDKQLMVLQQQLDAVAQRPDEQSKIEFWFARDLQIPLGYTRWENFLVAIQKAITSCDSTGFAESDHFRGVTKMVRLGSGSERPVDDFMLTRYACYLIAQNGDPRKPEIAFAQSYFAVQTRKQELIEDRIRSSGDEALFGGHTTQAMKKKFGIVKSRPLADFLPTLTIAAKNLANEMTNHNVQQANLHGEPVITSEHVQNNESVREMLGQRGIKPELLPIEGDLKKLERRVKAEEKQLGKSSALVPDTGTGLFKNK